MLTCGCAWVFCGCGEFGVCGGFLVWCFLLRFAFGRVYDGFGYPLDRFEFGMFRLIWYCWLA